MLGVLGKCANHVCRPASLQSKCFSWAKHHQHSPAILQMLLCRQKLGPCLQVFRHCADPARVVAAGSVDKRQVVSWDESYHIGQCFKIVLDDRLTGQLLVLDTCVCFCGVPNVGLVITAEQQSAVAGLWRHLQGQCPSTDIRWWKYRGCNRKIAGTSHP